MTNSSKTHLALFKVIVHIKVQCRRHWTHKQVLFCSCTEFLGSTFKTVHTHSHVQHCAFPLQKTRTVTYSENNRLSCFISSTIFAFWQIPHLWFYIFIINTNYLLCTFVVTKINFALLSETLILLRLCSRLLSPIVEKKRRIIKNLINMILFTVIPSSYLNIRVRSTNTRKMLNDTLRIF